MKKRPLKTKPSIQKATKAHNYTREVNPGETPAFPGFYNVRHLGEITILVTFPVQLIAFMPGSSFGNSPLM